MLNPNISHKNLPARIHERYSRHIIIDEITITGQKRIKESKILIVGAGGLSSPALLYLATCGIGTIGIIDNDIVETSNLQRQVIYTTRNIKRKKVLCALNTVKSINPHINIITYSLKLSENNAEEMLYDYDIVIDGTDNFNSRNTISKWCYLLHKIHIYGAIEKFNGQISVFNYQNGPNYFSISSTISSTGFTDCNTIGIVNTLAGLTGIIQATEAIKIITGIGSVLNGQLLNINILNLSFKKINIKVHKNQKITKEFIKQKKCTYKIKYISVDNIQNLNKKNIIFLDVRDSLFKIKKIKRAIHIPLRNFKRISVIKHIKHKFSKKIIIIYCNNELQSYLASQILYNSNIDNYILFGGINQFLIEEEREGFEPSLSIT